MSTFNAKLDSAGCPVLDICYEGKPSWQAFGLGHKYVRVRLEKSGTLSIEAKETPQSGKGAKHVFVDMPPEMVAVLLEILNQSRP